MKETSFREALTAAMDEEMTRDPNVFLIGEDIGLYGGVFGVTKGLLARYGAKRVRQTPISESAIVGAAIGASMIGLRPVAEIMYFDFAATCMDQIINQAAKIRYVSNGQVKLPMVIRTQAGGGRGKGCTHSQYLEALFFHVPGIKIVAPATAHDAKGLLKSAIRDDSPVLFLENAFFYNKKEKLPEEEYTVPLGEAAVRKTGRDLTLVTYASMVDRCLQAADSLEHRGVSAEVIDLRTLVPMDVDTVVKSVRKTERCVIVHEAYRRGGIGAEIASLVMEKVFDYLDAPIGRVGALETPIPFAESLEREVLPSLERIERACFDVVGKAGFAAPPSA
ncbi:MAG: alpha-ketoacid dehydrogenase subunit beta [Acidobacteriota bacterium]